MNAVNIIGTIVKDVELKYLPSGLAVGSFSIAVNQDYKNKEGAKVEKTSFFEIKSIGKQSEVINQYFKKGSRIGISGELEQESWTTQDGSNRSKVVIKLSGFSFIDRKSDTQQAQPKREPQVVYERQELPDINVDEFSDTIPF